MRVCGGNGTVRESVWGGGEMEQCESVRGGDGTVRESVWVECSEDVWVGEVQ